MGGASVPARGFQRLVALLEVLGDQSRQLVVAVGLSSIIAWAVAACAAARCVPSWDPYATSRVSGMIEGKHALRVELRLVEESRADQLLEPLRQRVAVQT